MDPNKALSLLSKAQITYGYANQVTVATEELCELAAVLSKYPRYPDHKLACEKLRAKIVEEMADVYIVLEHLTMIFDISQTELDASMDIKLERLERWLSASSDFYQTTIDREVKPNG